MQKVIESTLLSLLPPPLLSTFSGNSPFWGRPSPRYEIITILYSDNLIGKYIYVRATSLYDNILVMGDMNYDLLSETKSKVLTDIMELYNLENMIREPTFDSRSGASLIDVALTTNSAKFKPGTVLDIGSSDGHSMIVAVTKTNVPKPAPRVIKYRSYKTVNPENYREDISRIPFSVCEVLDDPDDILWAQ